MSTGFTFPWEKAAMHGEELPEGLSLPDQMAYTCLRNIYFLYYNKTISRDQAAAEKQRIRVQWERAASVAEFERKLSEHHAMVIRETEAAKTACRKDPTAENALRLCNAIDGLPSPDIAGCAAGSFWNGGNRPSARNVGPCVKSRPRRNMPCSTQGAGTDHLSLSTAKGDTRWQNVKSAEKP